MKKLFLILLCIFFGYADSFISASYRGNPDHSLMQRVMLNSSLALIESEGDIENLRNLFKKQTVSLGVVQKDILDDLIADDEKAKENLVIISPLYQAAIVIISPLNNPLRSIKELSNKRIITDLKGSGSYYTLLKFEELYNITPEIYQMKIDEAVNYLKRGKADALFFVGDFKKIANLSGFSFAPVLVSSYGLKSFSYGKNKTVKTAYVDKFLVSTKSKVQTIPKRDIHSLLQTLLLQKQSQKDYLCGYDLNNLNLSAKSYIYFICSENIETSTRSFKKNEQKKRVVKKELYYDSIEDITIYPKALKSKNFVSMNTSYIIEKSKLDNALKLFRKELKENPNQKLYIISTGYGNEATYYVNLIYKTFKKARIPRGNLMKKVQIITKECPNEECIFKNTKIKFQLL